MNIPKSVEIYVDEVAAILSWFKPGEWVHQDEFDRLSSDWKRSRGRRKVTLHRFTNDTILPPMNGDLNLAILQELQRAGIVRGQRAGWDENGKGTVKYRLVETAEA